MDQVPEHVIRKIQEVIQAATGALLAPDAALRLHGALGGIAARMVPEQDAGRSQEVTVLLADLRGFTLIAESQAGATVVQALNRFLARMCEIAIYNGGTIDKFMGDAIMVLFGAPVQGSQDARNAITCAVQMQIAMDEINEANAALGLPPVYMGVGINTGVVMAATLGSPLYSEYTVIGDEVNIASRIEAFSLRGQVLISESTFERCDGFVRVGEPMDVHVKGKSRVVRLREVLGIPGMGLDVPRQDVRKSLRVQTHLPFVYRTIADKIVLPQERRGMVLDISYEGMLASVDAGTELHSDICVDLDLSLVGGNMHRVYAKVLSVRQDVDGQYAGIAFTALSPQAERDIRLLVQLLVQGSPTK